MEKVCPWCGQPSDQRRLKNRTDFQSRHKQLIILCHSLFLGVLSLHIYHHHHHHHHHHQHHLEIYNALITVWTGALQEVGLHCSVVERRSLASELPQS